MTADVFKFLDHREGAATSDITALVREFGIDEHEAAQVFCEWLDGLTRRKRTPRMTRDQAGRILPELTGRLVLAAVSPLSRAWGEQ